MGQQDDQEFEILKWGMIIQTPSARSHDRERQMPSYHFERPVSVRHNLVCQHCGREFSYDFDRVLDWEASHPQETSAQDALKQLLARERQRTLHPGRSIPVACPHCHAVQGDGAMPLASLVAKVLSWFKR